VSNHKKERSLDFNSQRAASNRSLRGSSFIVEKSDKNDIAMNVKVQFEN